MCAMADPYGGQYYAQGDDAEQHTFSVDEWQEACWLLIDSYFAEKGKCLHISLVMHILTRAVWTGLVRQQLDSFNEFIEVTIQQIVKQQAPVQLQRKEQYRGNDSILQVCDSG